MSRFPYTDFSIMMVTTRIDGVGRTTSRETYEGNWLTFIEDGHAVVMGFYPDLTMIKQVCYRFVDPKRGLISPQFCHKYKAGEWAMAHRHAHDIGYRLEFGDIEWYPLEDVWPEAKLLRGIVRELPQYI